MAKLAFVALIALFVSMVVASDVLTLTEANFEETLKAENVLLVEFYAPWCGHCKALAPKYEAAATELKGIAKIAKVDCTNDNDLCGEHNVRGYPTLKLFRAGQPSDYQGPREADAIVRFMKKQVQPTVAEVDAANFQAFSESDKVVVVAFVDSKDSAEYKAFATVAEALRNDFTFGVSVAHRPEGIKSPGLVLYKKFDEGKVVYSGSFEEGALQSFIKTNSIPDMADIGPENYSSYVDSGLPMAYLFVSSDAERKELGPPIEAVARKFKGKVNFVYIDAVKYGGHASNLNLKQEWPAFAIQKPQENLKFPYAGTINQENIQKFVEDFVNGALTPSVKSEPVPVQNGPVTVVVHDNYKEVVEAHKDVLIEFYAPWCGHCKKLAPIYDELGDALKDNSNIVIAKMDATANDLPAGTPFQIQGFPTIKLVTAENKVVDFNGDRTVEGFINFLKANAVHGSSIGATAQTHDRDEL